LSFGYVLVTLLASNSTPCIISIEKMDSELMVTCQRTAATEGSSPFSFTAMASRMPAIVLLVDSGVEIS
jgi:hypothetical protein